MDMGIVRGIITIALMLAFAGLCLRTWSRDRRREYEAMARLPLEESAAPESAGESGVEGGDR